MKKGLGCYVRPYRRRWGLTQKELAYLIGAKSRSSISRIERQKREPTLTAAFIFHIVFGTQPDELFPALFAEVEDGVMARAYELYEQLQGNPSKATRVKLDLLEDMFARAQRRGKNKKIV